MKVQHLTVLVAAFFSFASQTQAGRWLSRNPENPQYSSGPDFSATWLGGNGNWSYGPLWSTAPAYPNNGNGNTYDAIIGEGLVTLDRDITIQKLYLNGGIINGFFDLTLNQGLDWPGGGLSTSGTINLGAGSTSTFSGTVSLTGSTINNFGTVFQDTDIADDTHVPGLINNLAGATWNVQGHRLPNAVTFNNAGNFVAVDTGIDGPFNNTGNVTVGSNTVYDFPPFYGGLTLNGGGTASGSFDVAENATLILSAQGQPQTYTFTTGAAITGAGFLFNYGVDIDFAGNTTITPRLDIWGGNVTVEPGVTLTLNSSFVQLGHGQTLLQGGTINSPNYPLGFGVDSELIGYGTVNGNVNFGEASLMASATGTLKINGNVSLLNNSAIIVEIGASTQGNGYSYLFATGAIDIGGKYHNLDCLLLVDMTNGFKAQLNGSDTFTVAHADGGFSGEFVNVANGQRTDGYPDGISFQVNYGEGSPYGADNLVLSKAATSRLLSGLTFPADAGIITPPFVASGGKVSQNIETTDPSLAGRAAYGFTILNPGEYTVSALVDAPGDGNNSFFINVDSEPTAPTMIWDIVSYTNGMESRTACWRGTGTFDAPQIIPKKFPLSIGVHELVIRGREVNTILGTITIAPDYLIKVSSVTKNFDGSVTLMWPGKPGKVYDVERSSNPGFQNSIVLVAGISQAEPECSFTDAASNLVGVQNAFYRIKLISAP